MADQNRKLRRVREQCLRMGEVAAAVFDTRNHARKIGREPGHNIGRNRNARKLRDVIEIKRQSRIGHSIDQRCEIAVDGLI